MKIEVFLINRMLVSLCVLFVISSLFLQMSAFYIMGGDKDGSYWIFNQDNLFRLTHVWQVLKSDSYPPSSLSNMDVSYHYHYGSVAIASFLMSLTGVSVDTAYFRVVMPLLLLSSIVLVYWSVYIYTKKKTLAVFSISLLLLASLNVGSGLNFPKLYGRMESSLYDLVLSIWSGDFERILNGSSAVFSHWYGNTIFDISYLMILVTISVALSLILLKKRRGRIVGLLVLFPFFVFLKAEAIIVGALLLTVEVLFFLTFRFGSRVLILLLVCIVGFVLALGFWEVCLVFPNSKLMFYFYDSEYLKIEYLFFFGIYFAMLVSLLFKRREYYDSYVLIYFLITILFFLLSAIIDVRITQNSSHVAISINDYLFIIKRAFYFMGLILYMISQYKDGNTFNKYGSGASMIFLLFFAFLVFFKMYHSVIQSWILLERPDDRYESMNHVKYKECLSNIPVANSIVYANHFRYDHKDWSDKKSHKVYLSAFYGHQAYASNFNFERYEIVLDRIKSQQKVLANKGSSIDNICSLMNSKNSYALLYKKADYPNVVKPYIVFENDVCMVFLPESMCK